MVFKGDGEGISCRQQSIKVGGGGLKLTANQMGIRTILIGGWGEESGKFCRDQTKIH